MVPFRVRFVAFVALSDRRPPVTVLAGGVLAVGVLAVVDALPPLDDA